MFPKSIQRCQLAGIKNQSGFLLPLSIFIVVVMGIFALVVSRNTIQSSTSAVLEYVSAQAFYAAETGAQRGMQNLFYPDSTLRQQVDQRCVARDPSNSSPTPLVITFRAPASPGVENVPGLNGCTITVTCTCRYADSSNCAPGTATNYNASAVAAVLTSYYQITSAATCGSATLRSTRTIDAGSFLRQE